MDSFKTLMRGAARTDVPVIMKSKQISLVKCFVFKGFSVS